MKTQEKINIALVGTTASGKTDLSYELADKFKTDIINIDSALVYKNMNIGTAKPDSKKLKSYKHHLIDIIEPYESYSVVDFLNDANNINIDLKNSNKNSFFVGGTMMYLNTMINGISILPESKPNIRFEIESSGNEKSWKYLHEILTKLDCTTANKIKPNDKQRITRALELIYTTGKTVTEIYATAEKIKFNDNLTVIALVPDDRKKLHDRIEKRFLKMLDEGFLDEVKSFYNNPLIDNNMASMKSVGYRQAWQYLDGNISYNQFVADGITATRRLAKRQMTWIRNFKGNIKIIDSLSNNFNANIKQYLKEIN